MTSPAQMAGALHRGRRVGGFTGHSARSHFVSGEVDVVLVRLCVGVPLIHPSPQTRSEMAPAAPAGQMPYEGEQRQEMRHATDQDSTSTGNPVGYETLGVILPASYTPEGLSSDNPPGLFASPPPHDQRECYNTPRRAGANGVRSRTVTRELGVLRRVADALRVPGDHKGRPHSRRRSDSARTAAKSPSVSHHDG